MSGMSGSGAFDYAAFTDALAAVDDEVGRLSRSAIGYKQNFAKDRLRVAQALVRDVDRYLGRSLEDLTELQKHNTHDLAEELALRPPLPMGAGVRGLFGMRISGEKWVAAADGLADKHYHEAIQSYVKAYEDAFAVSPSTLAEKFVAVAGAVQANQTDEILFTGKALVAARVFLGDAQRDALQQDYARLYLFLGMAGARAGEASEENALWLYKRLGAVQRGHDVLLAADLHVCGQVLSELLALPAGEAFSANLGCGAEQQSAPVGEEAQRLAKVVYNALMACLEDLPEPATALAAGPSVMPPNLAEPAAAVLAKLAAAPAALWHKRLVGAYGQLKVFAENELFRTGAPLRPPAAELQAAKLQLLRVLVPRNGYTAKDYSPLPPLFSALEASLHAAERGDKQARRHLLAVSEPGEGKTEGLWAYLAELCADSRKPFSSWQRKIWVSWPEKAKFYSQHFSASEARVHSFFAELQAELEDVDGLVVLVLDEVQAMLAADRAERTLEDEKVMTSFLSYLDQSRLSSRVVVVAMTNDEELLAPPARDRFNVISYASPRGVYLQLARSFTEGIGWTLADPGGEGAISLAPLLASCLAYLPPRRASDVVAQARRNTDFSQQAVFALLAGIQEEWQKRVLPFFLEGEADPQALALLGRRGDEPLFRNVHLPDGSSHCFGSSQTVGAVRQWQRTHRASEVELLGFHVDVQQSWACVTYMHKNARVRHFTLAPQGRPSLAISTDVWLAPSGSEVPYAQAVGGKDWWRPKGAGHRLLHAQEWSATLLPSPIAVTSVYAMDKITQPARDSDLFVVSSRLTPMACEGGQDTTHLFWLNAEEDGAAQFL